MTQQMAVDLARQALMTAFWTSLPLLVVGFIAGVAIGLAQVVTSLQDAGFAAVPRLGAFFVAVLLVLPWMASRMVTYTIELWSNLGRYAG
ncbi:MAG: flagellar biosynthetic protein FliQ [Bryobacteraceae bacterium]